MLYPKNTKMRLILVFFITLISIGNADANALQQPIAAKVNVSKKILSLQKDSSVVELRKFNQDSVQHYSKQKEFIYDDVAPASLSWWDRFWRWFWDWVNDLFSGGKTAPFVKYLVIALVIGIIVFIVIKLIGVDFKLLTGKSKTIAVPYEESLENIHEINFDDQIEKAKLNGNFRLVVRLLYLKTLKQLSDKNLINWQPEKTNQTYVAEMQNQQYHDEFANLTTQFEYIWYGEFYIDEKTFEPIRTSFQQFNQQAI